MLILAPFSALTVDDDMPPTLTSFGNSEGPRRRWAVTRSVPALVRVMVTPAISEPGKLEYGGGPRLKYAHGSSNHETHV